MRVFKYLNWTIFIGGYILAWILSSWLFAWSSLGAKAISAAAFLLLAVLTIIVFKHTNKKDSPWWRFLYQLVFGILGVGFIFLLVTLLAWLGYLILGLLEIPLSLDVLRPLILVLVAVLTLISIYQAREPKVKSYEVKINKLPDSWVDKKIVHLSDLHLGPIWREKFLKRVLKKVQSLAPEAIFISGDLFDGSQDDFSWLGNLLNEFQPPRGVYYSFGNHDLDLGSEKIHELLDPWSIEILENRLIQDSGLQIIGLNFQDKNNYLSPGEQLAKIPYQSDKPSILLYHEPKDPLAFKIAGIDLQLSGHTHGGQIFPFNLVAANLYDWRAHGLYQDGHYHLSVSSGVGTWGPPLRLGTRSEIVLITLKNA
jgi:predicted MPP superfamily phosphohydrolase